MSRWRRNWKTPEEVAAKKLRRHEHLRQIKQSLVHREKIHGEFFHAGDDLLARLLARVKDVEGKLLVASDDRHVRRLEKSGRSCVWHVERPVDPDDVLLGRIARKPNAAGDFSKFDFAKLAPIAAFSCLRLQRQGAVERYLQHLRRSVPLGAPVGIVVPNAHHELVDDHVNLFTAGTLVYNLVRAGWDCSKALVYFDKRFINVLVDRVDVPEPVPTTVDNCGPYMPFKNVFNYCSSEFPEIYRYELGPGRWS